MSAKQLNCIKLVDTDGTDGMRVLSEAWMSAILGEGVVHGLSLAVKEYKETRRKLRTAI